MSKINGQSPRIMLADDVQFYVEHTRWTCFCGSKGNGMATMFEHASTHLDQDGEAFISLDNSGYSICDPQEYRDDED